MESPEEVPLKDEGAETEHPKLSWDYVSDSILLKIFNFLQVKDLVTASEVCQLWRRVSRDNSLWQDLFRRSFKIGKGKDIEPQAPSWYAEYKRIKFHIPKFNSEVLSHDDEITDLSFSSDGKKFASCSADGSVKLWSSSYPSSLIHQFEMKHTGWLPYFSTFNESGTMLMVKRTFTGNILLGESVVFGLQDFTVKRRIISNPGHLPATWFSDNFILSSQTYKSEYKSWGDGICLTAANPTEGLYMYPLFKLRTNNICRKRRILIANCRMGDNDNDVEEQDIDELEGQDSFADDEASASGNGSTYEKMIIYTTSWTTRYPHVLVFKRIRDIEFSYGVNTDITIRHVLRNRRVAEEHLLEFPDKVMDMNGYIVDLSLSSCQRYLTVESRAFPKDYVHVLGLDPPLDDDTDIDIIDLKSFNLFCSLKQCSYCSSSATDSKVGELWDEHYGMLLACFPHDAEVTSIGLNPADSEMAVTVGVDNKIKIWRSSNNAMEYRRKGLK